MGVKGDTMVNVRLENIEKKFGDVSVLKNLNFKINDGEFFILLGASGSGKSTTLNIISGLEKQTSGNIYFDDEEVTKKGPNQRGVAMVFQDYALYPHMSVYKNMAFPLKMSRKSKEYIDKKVKETAKILEITELLDRKPRELSGGQAQRVALGRSLVRDPKIFLLDEPLSNLDTNIRSQIRTELKSIHRDLGKTFVYVTHDQQEALSMGDRIAILNEGKVEQLDAPSVVYNNPKTAYVANFLGEPKMNSFNLKRSGNIYTYDDIVLKGLSISNDSIILSVRPENIEIGKKISEEYVSLPLNVKLIEDYGSYLVIRGITKEGQSVSIRNSEMSYRTLSGNIDISIPITKCYFFDAETGIRIMESETGIRIMEK